MNDDLDLPFLVDDEPPTQPAPKRPRGFAAIDPEKRRAIASKGGKAAHLAGTAHKFTTAEASAAGKKGGTAPHKSRGKRKAA